jgi:hypothetical protein
MVVRPCSWAWMTLGCWATRSPRSPNKKCSSWFKEWSRGEASVSVVVTAIQSQFKRLAGPTEWVSEEAACRSPLRHNCGPDAFSFSFFACHLSYSVVKMSGIFTPMVSVSVSESKVRGLCRHSCCHHCTVLCSRVLFLIYMLWCYDVLRCYILWRRIFSWPWWPFRFPLCSCARPAHLTCTTRDHTTSFRHRRSVVMYVFRRKMKVRIPTSFDWWNHGITLTLIIGFTVSGIL